MSMEIRTIYESVYALVEARKTNTYLISVI